jgi:murein L,D-transpeptidase YcbB/YkuD
MSLPKQIQDQQAFSEEYDRQVKEASAPEPQPPEPPAEPQPAPAPQPTPAPAPQPEPEADVWRQRYLSLQGMFNSTVPQLQQELKDLRAELAKAKEAPKPAEPKPTGKLVTKADEEAFGADLVDMVRRGAREEIEALQERHAAEIATMKAQLAEAQQGVTQVTEVQTKSVRDNFFTTLETRVPQWEQVQATAECQNWLGTRVPGMQHTWNDALVSAADRFDVEAVTEVFGEFYNRHPQLKPGHKPAPPPPRNREELNRQVTPPRSHASVPTPSGDKRRYSGQEYEQESMKIIRLTQHGKRAEAEALEAELNAALREGRVG